jgi:ParB family chromosome partitioning protein
MQLPWKKSLATQLDLLDAKPEASSPTACALEGPGATANLEPAHRVPDTGIDELVDDIRQHGILQPLTVHPADAQGRYRIHFGAKRWRAAQRAGLAEVPIVVREAPADPYTQIAENQRRHALTPLDLARFIKGRADEGESNAFIAGRMSMNLTTVAHHLSLLELPPALDQALKSGRCTSPRTLYELSKLHVEPDSSRGPASHNRCRSAIASLSVATLQSGR